MKKIINWISGLLRDEKGTPSSKRFIGITAGLSLCIALFVNLYTVHPVETSLINAVAGICFGGLGLASIDKIWGKKDTKKDQDSDQQINS